MTPTDRSAAETIRLLNAENAALLEENRVLEKRLDFTVKLLSKTERDLVATQRDLAKADDEIERCIADREFMRDERDVARASGSHW